MDIATYTVGAAAGSVIGFLAYALLLGILWGAAAIAWPSVRRTCKAHAPW